MESKGSRERRPLKSRNLGSIQYVAAFLADRAISANTISVLGLVFGLLAGVSLAATARLPDFARFGWLLGGVLIQLRLLANLLDGMVALQSETSDAIGELYNEVPDRITDTAILIGLGYAAGGSAVLGYLAALTAVFTAYVRAMGKCAGAPQEFCGPMAKPQRMALVTAIAVYCAAAPLSWQSVGAWGVPALALGVSTIGALATAIRRLRKIGSRLRIGP